MSIDRTWLHPAWTGRDGGIDDNPLFKVLGANKLGIRLDIAQPKGAELLKRLVKISDVLVECASPGTMDKFGLDYKVLSEVNPSLIMLSTTVSGQTGPEAHYKGYAPLFTAMSGLGELTGYPDGPPTEVRWSSDFAAAYWCALALMYALLHRQKTGRGLHIDASTRESLSLVCADSLMAYLMNSRNETRQGNRDEIMAPHNCYCCKGSSQWVSIAIGSEEEWNSFCQAIGNPKWAQEESFSDMYRRWKNQEEMDKYIEVWTLNHSSYEVMQKLQQVGVAAVPSLDGEQLFADPHIGERGMWQLIEDTSLGTIPLFRWPWELSATPLSIRYPAPLFGQHNEYVFGELLGMSKKEIAALEEERILY